MTLFFTTNSERETNCKGTVKLEQNLQALHERDSHAQESRDRETRILSLMNELETLKADFEQADRQRRQQQQELNDLVRFYKF